MPPKRSNDSGDYSGENKRAKNELDSITLSKHGAHALVHRLESAADLLIKADDSVLLKYFKEIERLTALLEDAGVTRLMTTENDALKNIIKSLEDQVERLTADARRLDEQLNISRMEVSTLNAKLQHVLATHSPDNSASESCLLTPEETSPAAWNMSLRGGNSNVKESFGNTLPGLPTFDISEYNLSAFGDAPAGSSMPEVENASLDMALPAPNFAPFDDGFSNLFASPWAASDGQL